MEKIKIITDSTCDLPKEYIEKYDIEVMPVLINFGEKSFLDGIEISRDEVFSRIEEGDVFPTTAQIVPNRFVDTFNKYLEEGYKVLAIIMSSNMSGTYQSACLAKSMIESEDIYIFDSQKICASLGLQVYKAAMLLEEGKNIDEIIKELEYLRNHTIESLSFDSLDNLVRGGRISKTVGVVSGVLGIKLILDMTGGIMSVKDKVRGSKKAIKRIISDLEDNKISKKVPVCLVNLDMEEISSPLRQYFTENNIDYFECEVGSSVGIHSGNKVSGVFFVEEN